MMNSAIHGPLHIHSTPELHCFSGLSARSVKCADESIHFKLRNENGALKNPSSPAGHFSFAKMPSLRYANAPVDMEESSSTVFTRFDEEEGLRRETALVAKEYYDETFDDAVLTIPDKSDTFPKFYRHQVLDGKILGRGAFCEVCEVRGFQHLNGPPPFARKKVNKSSIHPPPPTKVPLSLTTSEPGSNGSPRQQGQPVSLGAFLQENIGPSALFAAAGNKWIPSVVSRLSGGLSSPTSAASRFHHEADEEVLKESRDFIANHCFRNGGDARYAIKCLSRDTQEDPEKLLQGIFDMATEARILSNITNHPNVIKMRAICEGGPFGGSDGFFIVLDRLYDTLEQRLVKWQLQAKRLRGIGAKLLRRDPDGYERDQLYEARLVAAYDLSSALAYLHKNRVIHRDLKPANIGFDIRGDIKIFDFGLAKVLPRVGADEDGRFNLTAMCGTMRYMAPEVGKGLPYDESCDTFSFAILLWEIMALERPYGDISVEDLEEQVWGQNRRPPIDSSPSRPAAAATAPMSCLFAFWQRRRQGQRQPKRVISTPLQILMKRGWSSNPDERPRMIHVERILRKECISFRNGDETGLEHNQRRSTHVFHHRSKTSRTL